MHKYKTIYIKIITNNKWSAGLGNLWLWELTWVLVRALAWSGGKVCTRKAELGLRHRWRGGGEARMRTRGRVTPFLEPRTRRFKAAREGEGDPDTRGLVRRAGRRPAGAAGRARHGAAREGAGSKAAQGARWGRGLDTKAIGRHVAHARVGTRRARAASHACSL
jgi:hypothetical protein